MTKDVLELNEEDVKKASGGVVVSNIDQVEPGDVFINNANKYECIVIASTTNIAKGSTRIDYYKGLVQNDHITLIDNKLLVTSWLQIKNLYSFTNKYFYKF